MLGVAANEIDRIVEARVVDRVQQQGAARNVVKERREEDRFKRGVKVAHAPTAGKQAAHLGACQAADRRRVESLQIGDECIGAGLVQIPLGQCAGVQIGRDRAHVQRSSRSARIRTSDG